MADVLVTRIWGVLVALYGVDIVATQLAGYSTEAGLALAVVGGWMAWRPSRVAPGVVAVVALAALAGPASSTETALVMWASLAVALFDGPELSAALRAIVVTAYAFAAANKLFDPFLSGGILDAYVPELPAPEVVAHLVVIGELGLAAAVALRWRYSVAVISCCHVIFAVLVGTDARHVVSLLVYGAMMAWAASVADPVRPERARLGVGAATAGVG